MRPPWLMTYAVGALGVTILAALVWLAFAVGRGSNEHAGPEQAATQTAAAGAQQDKIQNFAYLPTPLSVGVGTSVTWTQYDAIPHTVTSGAPGAPDAGAAFDSGIMQQNATFSFTFKDPGTYAYFCRLHTDMKATVLVADAQGKVPFPTPASQAAAVPTPAPPPANARLIADGLINPRGFTFGPDGALYVAETGTPPQSGVRSAPTPAPGAAQATPTPKATVNPLCESTLPDYDKAKAGCPGVSAIQTNMNGRISRIGPDGVRTTVADRLPVVVSIFNDMIGPNGVAFVGSDLYVIIAAGETRGHPDFPTGVYRVLPDGSISLFANLEAFQKANPPRFIPEDYNFSLPYDVIAAGGKLYITDGNAQVIFEVDPAAPEPSRIRRVADMSVGHPVLTGMAVGQDGNLYVANFTPAPYPAGGAKVFKVTLDGTISEAAGGLSLATGLAIAPDGAMYVSEFGKPPFAAPPGRIVKIGSGGTVQEAAGPLTYPTVIRWGPDGLYVTNVSVGAESGAQPRGAIYRIDTGEPGGR